MGDGTKPYPFLSPAASSRSLFRPVELDAFVRLRALRATHKDLARKLEELEKQLGQHDEKFKVVFEAIRRLMAPPPPENKRRIGFARE